MKYLFMLIVLSISMPSNATNTRELYEGCNQAKFWHDAKSPTVTLSKAGKKCIYYMQGFDAGMVASAINSCSEFNCKAENNPYALHCGVKYGATTYDHISAFVSWVGNNPKVMEMPVHLVIGLALNSKFPCDA